MNILDTTVPVKIKTSRTFSISIPEWFFESVLAVTAASGLALALLKILG